MVLFLLYAICQEHNAKEEINQIPRKLPPTPANAISAVIIAFGMSLSQAVRRKRFRMTSPNYLVDLASRGTLVFIVQVMHFHLVVVAAIPISME
jgi:hypothetical protein